MSFIAHDQSERIKALDVTQSFIVQAPAGSGKTELLLQRFLTLLTTVSQPEEILAITFTKKAANEMRTRIINALKQAHALHTAPENDHAKNTWHIAKKVLAQDQLFKWQLLDNPNQLRIQTIDSFCAYLTKQLPFLSHFGASPVISDAPLTLYRTAVSEVLLHVETDCEWRDAIAKLLLHLDNDLNKLHDLMVSLLARRDQWLPYIKLHNSDAEIKNTLESHLQDVISDSLQNIKEIFPKSLASDLLSVARFAASQLPLDSSSLLLHCDKLTQLPGSDFTDKKLWHALASLLLTKSFTWRKRVDAEIGFKAISSFKNPIEKNQQIEYRKKLQDLLQQMEDQEHLRLALIELFFLPEGFYDDGQWQILQSMLQVLKVVVAQLRLTFKQCGQIDFIENTQAALLALGSSLEPTDLALALDYQIKHILIDEFQDTSLTQYQLLEKLTLGFEEQDGRTLFIVGDPMQSIYRFREAEVGLFLRMRKNGIGHIKLNPLTLSENFRSHAKLVEWNNLHFAQIFPKFNDVATGAVSYSKSTVQVVSVPHATVSIKGFTGDKSQQSKALIEMIKSTQENYPDEKIAILVRSRSHLADIIPLLKEHQLSYQAINIDPLASRQYIQDLLSLTCALLHPADRIAWLAILRSPWCGLTLTDLFAIANENAEATIYEQLLKPEIVDQLSPDGQIRINRILPILKYQMAERARLDARTWIENTWLQLGGPATLAHQHEMQDVNYFFQLLETPNQVIDIDQLKEKIGEAYASTQNQEDKLQILTIHTAKGLEFDTVILPHLEKKMPSDDKSLLSWMERPLSGTENALLLAPVQATGNQKDLIYEYIAKQQRVKLNYEVNRLFYVATTRAKKRLHLLFSAEKKTDEDYKIESGSFLESLWPYIKNDKTIMSADLPQLTELVKSESKTIKRFVSNWSNPLPIHFRKTSTFHQQTEGFQLQKIRAITIGIVTHKILYLLSTVGITWWQAQNDIHKLNYINRQLTTHSLPRSELQDSARLILQAIQNTLTHPKGQWILHHHLDAHSEYNLTTLINQQPATIIIDRTFIDNEGIRWIIDYKTTTFSAKDMEDFFLSEQDKYLTQMQKYANAIRLADEKRPIRLGLFFPCLPAFHEWTLDVI